MPEETTTWDKIKEAARAIFGKGSKPIEAGTGYQRPVTKEMESYDRQAISQNRRETIIDCTKMIAIDPRAGRIVRKLAADARVGGFSVNITTAPSDAVKEQAMITIQGVIDKCKVVDNLKGWTKSMLRAGDLFWEVVVDDKERTIVRLKKLAAIITMSNMNSQGNFPDDKPAYYQEHPWSRQPVKTFEHWQIVQIGWDREDGEPYGTPLFASARLAYERLDSGEKNLVARRAVKAGVTRHHKVGTAETPGDWADVEDYKKFNKDTLDHPLDPVKEFYSNGLVDIKELQGDTALGDIDDIMHFAGQLPLNAGIPIALLSGGWEEKVNRDVLDEQNQDYYRVVDDVNTAMEAGLRQVFSFALLLAGINDEALTYTINWGSKDRDDIDAKIARGKELQALGFSHETVVTTCDLDGVTYEEEVERIRKQVEAGIVPYGVGMGKLDPQLMMFLGLIGAAGGAKTEALMEQIEKLQDTAEAHLTGSSDSVKKILALTQGKRR